MYQRYVALGDSFTEGVGDPDPGRPNGVRGWADRVAEALADASRDVRYANLAVRGRKLAAIVEEQVGPACELKPDLVTLQGAGNDLLRPQVDIDALVAKIDEATGRLQDAGATVVLFTHGDGGSTGVFGAIRGRVAIFNELLREVVERRDTVLVDTWRLPGGRDPRFWDEDRLHLSPAGHQSIAIHALDTLGVPHSLEPLPLPDRPRLSPREKRAANLRWARSHAAPWVHRRLTGRSSGDSVSPKRPELVGISPPGADAATTAPENRA